MKLNTKNINVSLQVDKVGKNIVSKPKVKITISKSN